MQPSLPACWRSVVITCVCRYGPLCRPFLPSWLQTLGRQLIGNFMLTCSFSLEPDGAWGRARGWRWFCAGAQSPLSRTLPRAVASTAALRWVLLGTRAVSARAAQRVVMSPFYSWPLQTGSRTLSGRWCLGAWGQPLWKEVCPGGFEAGQGLENHFCLCLD